MGNSNGRAEVMIADGPDIGGAQQIDDNVVINQGTSARPQPQLLFHSVHGSNVRIYKGGRMAKRVESFCKGLAFSNRPIAIDENVCLRFVEMATNWSGVLRFGVTNTDPSTLRSDLPKFACPDLTSKEGNWAKALAERYCVQSSVLHFYVRDSGDMYYGINGVLKGLFLSGINTMLPLWVMVDIYGNSNALEFVDPSEVRIRSSRTTRPLAQQLPNATSTASNLDPSARRGPMPLPSSSRVARISVDAVHPSASPAITTGLASMSIGADSSSPSLRHPARFHAGVNFERLTFHTMRGKNITLTNDYSVASRFETEYSAGYVFTARPIGIGEKIVIQVLSVLPVYQGGIAFGLTCCDPIHLRPDTLPDDSDDLLERGEYWVGIKDVAAKPNETDELAFWINESGEVHFYRNNSRSTIIMHVDHSQKLWMWFDLYGSTQKIRILGITSVSSRSVPSSSSSNVGGDRRTQSSVDIGPAAAAAAASIQSQQHQRVSTSGELRVSLPPPMAPTRPPPPQPRPSLATTTTTTTNAASTSADVVSTSSNATASRLPPLPPRPSPYARPPVTTPRTPTTSTPSVAATAATASDEAADECSICMVAAANSVIYTCGHMCMCWDCACETWRVKGECPICRKAITDVIRIYKS